jgi:glucosamine-6-phosphate deaminase
MRDEQRKHPGIMVRFDSLIVRVCPDRNEMGKAAAVAVAERMRFTIRQKGHARMVFAAAPSQVEFFAELTATPDIEWRAVTAFHMDEYLGLGADHAQLFGMFLRTHLFGRVSCGAVHIINPVPADPWEECRRYADLLRREPIDIVCLGIGENGHLAFNDPPAADFHDRAAAKVVDLDVASRQQQVNDGCFPDLASVPGKAITLTIPALMSGIHLSCVVPGQRKARAVAETLEGPVQPGCPASILRTHPDAVLYLDRDSASEIL